MRDRFEMSLSLYFILTKGTRGCKSGSVSKLKKASRFSIAKPGCRELLGLRKQSFV